MKWFAQCAWLPTGVARDVLIEADQGRLTAIEPGGAPGDASRLPGIVVPGFANGHSHAFHRALRGRTQAGGGTFWTWREAMYSVAGRLDPDSYLALARATYAEMVLSGITSVGEFHYLHHAPGGERYAEENVMAEALRQAASDAGIRMTLLDTCYLTGGLEAGGHKPLAGPQLRFSDGDVGRWAERVEQLAESDGMRVGVAIHSVRAVPRASLGAVSFVAAGRPLHAHVSEQPAENAACQAYYGATATTLLDDEGALGPTTTAVHATHLTDGDVELLGHARTTICFCPTTERDLADGIGPATRLRAAGCPITVGTDQHAMTDLLEEARALEMDERLASGERGRFTPAELLTAMTGHAAVGWPEAGRLEVGAAADLVAVRLDTVRTAGCAPEQALLAATAADVDTVIVAGRPVVEGGAHRLGDVAALLAASIEPMWVGG
ncbi:MAG TPA: formimidoylglutamate deiminase [Mycobacteriales bacterium]|nr:formimidoylglutamate deiminase [Mycobacteriales bacterium]